jgi:hypothetical protein
MRDNIKAPEYFVCGVGDLWEVRRTHDLARAAFGVDYTTDDGVPGVHILPRKWDRAQPASDFIDSMEEAREKDDKTLTGGTVYWLADRNEGGVWPLPPEPHSDPAP